MTLGTFFPRGGGPLEAAPSHIKLIKAHRQSLTSSTTSATVTVTGLPAGTSARQVYCIIPSTSTQRTINSVKHGSTVFTRTYGTASNTAQETVWKSGIGGDSASFSITIALSASAVLGEVLVFVFEGLTYQTSNSQRIYNKQSGTSFPVTATSSWAVIGRFSTYAGRLTISEPSLIAMTSGYEGGGVDEWGDGIPSNRYENGGFCTYTNTWGSLNIRVVEDAGSDGSPTGTLTAYHVF